MSKSAELRQVEALRRAGKTEKASELMRRLVADEPRDAELRRRHSELLVEAGKKDAAISELVKLQELQAVDGDLLGAIASGLKVIELDPRFENPLAYVAKVKTDSLRAEQTERASRTVPVAPITPLDQIPLLRELSAEELSLVASTMRRHEVAEEAVVFREGDAGESLFFVNRGRVEALAEAGKLGSLGPGQCFGEFSFLTGQPRTATVRALEPSELLELSADKMRRVVQSHPRLRDVLFELYRERALVNVLSLSPLFQVLPSRDRARLAPRFDLVVLEAGEEAFSEGETGSALFVVKHGELEVKARVGGEELVLAVLGQHQFFGEVSFLTGVRRTATVRALTSSELLRIDEAALKDLLRHHPYMREVLSQYHLDRVTATADTLKAFLRRGRVEGIVR